MVQTDLFGHQPSQSELFAPQSTAAPEAVPVTPESVRSKMLLMLDQLRAADHMPWPERKVRINEVIFPQMANWLPEEEAAQLCFAFTREIERLKLAA
jgi:hypothetical protein